MVLIKERIGKMLEYLKDQIYPESVPIGKYRMIKIRSEICRCGES